MLMTKRKPASVGEILVDEFIEPLGLTQGELAEAMGVSRQTINSIENERYTPSLPLAIALARYFGVPIEEMFGEQRR